MGEMSMVHSPRFCDHCGATNQGIGNFCAICGYPLQHKWRTPFSDDQSLSPLHMLKQRYQITAKLGVGGFGTIYQAEDLAFHHAIRAIKEMRISNLTKQEERQAIDAFKREAVLLAGLMHPHLPRIYDHFEDHGRWYLVMDFIEGETLGERLWKAPEHVLPLPFVIHVTLQLCTVLSYLHSRNPPIIFRDLKPANIMMTPDDHLYLIDFGIARLFKPEQSGDTLVLGSPGYAAPEQYGKAQTTERADIYSMGATLHQLLSGRDPIEDPFQFPFLHLDKYPQIGPAFARLIQQMLEMKRENRPSNVQAIKQEVVRIAQISLGSLPSASLFQSSSQDEYKEERIARSTFVAPQSASTLATEVPSLSTEPVKIPIVSQPSLLPSTEKVVRVAPLSLKGVLLYTYQGHKDTANITTNVIRWSPDSKRIASASSRSLHVWNVKTGHVDFSEDFTSNVAWSPDGSLIATGRTRLCLRDAQTGQILQEEGTFSERIWDDFAWSLDGKYIFAVTNAHDRKGIDVYHVSLGKMVTTYNEHTLLIHALCCSPDGTSIASASRDGTVRIWQVIQESAQSRGSAQGTTPTESTWGTQTKRTYRGHERYVFAVAWSPDGSSIASGGLDRQVHIWDSTTGQPMQIYRNHTAPIRSLSWSPDSLRIASASEDGTVQIWNVVTGACLCSYPGHQGKVQAVSWSPDGAYIASAGDDQTVQIWQLADNQVKKSIPMWEKTKLVVSQSIPAITAPALSSVALPRQGQLLYTYRNHSKVGHHLFVQWSPDGNQIASCDTFDVRVWNATTGKTSFSESVCENVAWSLDGRWLATTYGTKIKQWNTSTWLEANTWDVLSQIEKILWSPNGEYLLVYSGTTKRNLYIYDAFSGKLLNQYREHEGVITTIGWSPDSNAIVSGDDKHTVHIWNALQGNTLLTYTKHWSFIRTVMWSPDGHCIASCAGDIHIWDAKTGETLLIQKMHEGPEWMRILSWSPDSLRIASAGFSNGTIHIWHAMSGTSQFVYTGHTKQVHDLAWSPDGKRIASSSTNQTIQVWQALPPLDFQLSPTAPAPRLPWWNRGKKPHK
jgi:eukaryotic-like serine/threonine-protein kinase